MSGEWDLKILCMGAGYVGGPTMAVIAKRCPKVSLVWPSWDGGCMYGCHGECTSVVEMEKNCIEQQFERGSWLASWYRCGLLA